MSTNLRKKSFKLFKNPSKNNSRADLGPRSAWKKLSQRLTRSGEIPSPGQTSIHKTNDCAMKSERGALFRGSDPPSGHSVYRTAGDTWRVPARRLIQHIWALLCRKQVTKFHDTFPMAKKRSFLLRFVWEKSVGRCGHVLAP